MTTPTGADRSRQETEMNAPTIWQHTCNPTWPRYEVRPWAHSETMVELVNLQTGRVDTRDYPALVTAKLTRNGYHQESAPMT